MKVRGSWQPNSNWDVARFYRYKEMVAAKGKQSAALYAGVHKKALAAVKVEKLSDRLVSISPPLLQGTFTVINCDNREQPFHKAADDSQTGFESALRADVLLCLRFENNSQ